MMYRRNSEHGAGGQAGHYAAYDRTPHQLVRIEPGAPGAWAAFLLLALLGLLAVGARELAGQDPDTVTLVISWAPVDSFPDYVAHLLEPSAAGDCTRPDSVVVDREPVQPPDLVLRRARPAVNDSTCFQARVRVRGVFNGQVGAWGYSGLVIVHNRGGPPSAPSVQLDTAAVFVVGAAGETLGEVRAILELPADRAPDAWRFVPLDQPPGPLELARPGDVAHLCTDAAGCPCPPDDGNEGCPCIVDSWGPAVRWEAAGFVDLEPASWPVWPYLAPTCSDARRAP